jgi:putative spermidine/putrescine transport system ATP-binding protein
MTAAPSPASDDGNAVELTDLRRAFGSALALDGLTMDIARGELVALLGPSGCGKTTALRALAGLEELDAGRVVVHGRDVTHLPPNKRDMGMVFQAYSLFPHLSALENVGYGLRLATRRVPAARRRARAGELLELVGLAEQANRFPHQMSGGQQQRVALARALAINPTVLLLDEPLSALDAKVRAQLRDEIRRIQTEVGATTLFVTHDQEEALGIADRVGVMQAGRLEQLAAPVELYDRPASAFVAEFVGQTNPVPGTVADGHVAMLGTRLPVLPGSVTTGAAVALVRPEWLRVRPDAAAAWRVVAVAFLGADCRVQVAGPDDARLTASVPGEAAAELPLGAAVDVTVSARPVFARPV